MHKHDELHLPSKRAPVLYKHATTAKHTHVDNTAETMLIKVVDVNAAVHGEWDLRSAIPFIQG